MVASETLPLIRYGNDTTLRWSCRRGDYLVWIAWGDVLADSAEMADFWEMRDGDYVTLTNRWEDVPSWFELHPAEASGSLVYRMMAKLDAGYRPVEKMDGPNIWRVKGGDRLVWVGESRPGQQAIGGLLAVLDCATCALVVGESSQSQFPDTLAFGAPTGEPDAVTIRRLQLAVQAVKTLGCPRTFAFGWALGR